MPVGLQSVQGMVHFIKKLEVLLAGDDAVCRLCRLRGFKHDWMKVKWSGPVIVQLALGEMPVEEGLVAENFGGSEYLLCWVRKTDVPGMFLIISRIEGNRVHFVVVDPLSCGHHFGFHLLDNVRRRKDCNKLKSKSVLPCKLFTKRSCESYQKGDTIYKLYLRTDVLGSKKFCLPPPHSEDDKSKLV